jgi:hypothetical protein
MKNIVLHSYLLLLPLFQMLPTAERGVPCTDWALYTERGKDYKVYTRECEDSPIKEFKVVDRFYANFDTLAKIMRAIETTQKLSESCTEAKIVRVLDANTVIQYFYFAMPMGITDRDVVTKNTTIVTQNTISSVSDYYEDAAAPLRNNVLRIKKAHTVFFYQKQADGSIALEYTARTDPNGTIPAWFVNMLAGQQARKMLEKLKRLAQK